MTSFTYDMVGAGRRGSVQAFRRSVGEVGAFSGPILGGLVAGISHAGVAFAAFAPLHLASALLVDPGRPRDAEPDAAAGAAPGRRRARAPCHVTCKPDKRSAGTWGRDRNEGRPTG